jgi:proteasome lid subunit RPN8/RPN11
VVLKIDEELLRRIHSHAEANYPGESAGVILGKTQGSVQRALKYLAFDNRSPEREQGYRLDAQDMLAAELQAMQLELAILGICHSHPDQPARPSAQDRQHALSWFSYLITSVQEGKAGSTRSWRFEADRGCWSEQQIEILLAGDIGAQGRRPVSKT